MDFTLFRINMVRHNRHNFIGSGKTVETLDENRRRERGGGRTWNPGYTRRFSLSRLNSGKLSSLKPLSQNWEHCFVRGNGTHFAFGHTRTNRYAHNQTGRNAGSLEKRVEEEEEKEENVQIILYPGEVEPVGDARPFESGIKSISLRDGAA